MARTHDLKVWPGPFRDMREGRKTYEIRSTEDRFFEVAGDLAAYRLDGPPSPVDGRRKSVVEGSLGDGHAGADDGGRGRA